MANGTDLPGLPDENLLSRRPWYLIGVVIILLSLVVSQPLLIVAGLLVILLGAVPEIWYRFCLVGIHVRRELSTQRADLGDEVKLTLVVENAKLLPLPRLELEDEVPEEGLVIRGAVLEAAVKPQRLLLVNALSLWVLQRVRRRYHVRCLQRGAYTFGPLHLTSGDPFGLLNREREDTDLTVLLVFPLRVPLERLGLPARAPLGERAAPHRLLEDPLRVAGVRQYVPGDEPRRIHWKATARTGTLQAKVFEPSTRHTLALFVDVRSFESAVLGYDAELLELTICAAASVAAWGIEQGFAVGLYANGLLADLPTRAAVSAGRPTTPAASSAPAASGAALAVANADPAGGADAVSTEVAIQRAIRQAQIHLRLPPSADTRHLVRMQEGLARLIPYYAQPIARQLADEERHLPFGSTVVYIGPATAIGADGLAVLRRLRARGHVVTLLIAGDAEITEPRLLVRRLGGADRWRALWEEALARHGITPTGADAPPAAASAPPADGHDHPSARRATLEVSSR